MVVHVGETVTQIDEDLILNAIDRALPAVYDYLLRRCGERVVAEDLTSETVLAVVDRVRAGQVTTVEVGYLIGIARHKLVDHWRRLEREQRHLTLRVNGDWDAHDEMVFEPNQATAALAALSPTHRAVLTLRYVDDLPVPEVARVLGRSVHATETLLIRAKRTFRTHYKSSEDLGRD